MISNKEELLAEAIDYTHFHPAAFIAVCFSHVFIIVLQAKRAETKKSPAPIQGRAYIKD